MIGRGIVRHDTCLLFNTEVEPYLIEVINRKFIMIENIDINKLKIIPTSELSAQYSNRNKNSMLPVKQFRD